MNDLNLEGLSDKQLRIFAVRCARRVQHLMTDPRSVAALDVAERHANGQATDEELKVAWDAANAAWAAANAAWDAARTAVRAAALDAAGAAASSARDAAWYAAWATARPADAARAAGAAARDVERVEQQKILDEIRQEQM
jgi:hypothetical protein